MCAWFTRRVFGQNVGSTLTPLRSFIARMVHRGGYFASSTEAGWGRATVVHVNLSGPLFTAAASEQPSLQDREHTIAPAGSVVPTERSLVIDDGLLIMPSTGARVCPQSAQVVPRQDLLRYLLPEEVAISRLQARLAATPAYHSRHGVRAVEVVFDTLLPDGIFGTLVAGVALNTTDSMLPPMVAALVVDSANPVRPGSPLVPDSLRARDTLEYYLGPMGPREIRMFVGGHRMFREVVVDRVAYPESTVKGRRVATELDRHWTSWARHREPYKLKELREPLP